VVYRAAMACTPALRALALALALTACGDDGSGDEFTSSTPITMTPPSGTTAEPTTGGTSSTGEPTTGEPGTTTTGDDGTTTTTGDDPTSSSSTGDESTGPICDPGQPNCVCDNGLCVDGYVCMGGSCMQAMVCDGDVEPPDEGEMAPTMLDDITDNDDDFHQVKGVLSGAGDTDWYRYHGSDTSLYVSEPTLEILSMTAGMRVCQFIQCDTGNVAMTQVTCPEGTKFAISPNLRPGCCHDTSFQISDFNCDGNDESLQAWIRLDMPDQDICVDYEFKLHF
jgi:hypothetical protein